MEDASRPDRTDDDSENSAPSAETPAALSDAGVHFPPPFIYLAGIVIGALLEQILPLYEPPAGPAALAGFVLVVLGIALSSASVGRFRAAETSAIPNRPASVLVTSGPYKFTRNPMYLALAIVYVGSALIVRMIWPLILLPAVLFTVVRYVIRREERYLESVFGDEYRRYRASTRRWL